MTFRHEHDPELRIDGECDELTLTAWYEVDGKPDHVAICGEMGEVTVAWDDIPALIEALREMERAPATNPQKDGA